MMSSTIYERRDKPAANRAQRPTVHFQTGGRLKGIIRKN